MPAWAAVFVGISVFKKPTVIGTFFGAFLISIMQNGFTLLNAPFYIMDLIVGVTLIGAILVPKFKSVAGRTQCRRVSRSWKWQSLIEGARPMKKMISSFTRIFEPQYILIWVLALDSALSFRSYHRPFGRALIWSRSCVRHVSTLCWSWGLPGS